MKKGKKAALMGLFILTSGIALTVRKRQCHIRPNKPLMKALGRVGDDEVSCVVIKDGVITHTLYGRGIAPILSLYDEGELKDAVVVDKIVGKAAAMIFSAGGVSSCYGVTMSKAGLEWLEKNKIQADYTTLAPSIQNRKGDGICPMEETVKEMTDEQEAICALRKKIEELKGERENGRR